MGTLGTTNHRETLAKEKGPLIFWRLVFCTQQNSLCLCLVFNSIWFLLENIHAYTPLLHSDFTFVKSHCYKCHVCFKIILGCVNLQHNFHFVAVSPNSCLWSHLLTQFRILSI